MIDDNSTNLNTMSLSTDTGKVHCMNFGLRYIVALLILVNLILLAAYFKTLPVPSSNHTYSTSKGDAALLQSQADQQQSLVTINDVGAVNSMESVGNDRDSHGCIPSAGYMWCEVLQKCVRPWETPCP
uniref:Uncharacterized protein n=1 Tax=Leptocylindrus danicus TaxID=163516 RepID=A0A7S2KWI4_9STRA